MLHNNILIFFLKKLLNFLKQINNHNQQKYTPKINILNLNSSQYHIILISI